MKKIGILSDTHDLLRPEVIQVLQGSDIILHGGDISSRKILDQLEQIAPVHVVRGNNDKDWAEEIPWSLDEEIFGLHVCMTHKKKDLPSDVSGYDLVIYGHSHKYEERRVEKTLFLNPGSCGPRRFGQAITLAVLYVEEGRIHRVERVEIPHEKTPAELQKADVKKSDIERVMKRADKGHSYARIAKDLHIQEEVAEQICRLYFTHPGVDADGIMKKMGL